MALQHLQNKQKIVKKKIQVINKHKLWFKWEHIFQNWKIEEERVEKSRFNVYFIFFKSLN